MRGKDIEARRKLLRRGITPAYAGKRIIIVSSISSNRDHPRVCGEKTVALSASVRTVESPPRMRGKGRATALRCRCTRDHPRVCGEKSLWFLCRNNITGSPPRMRGKDRCTSCQSINTRITPAYAGKSIQLSGPLDTPGDHPRVCGEKCSISLQGRSTKGSPPRMRGKVAFQTLEHPDYWDHPRVCGEKGSRSLA